MIDLNQDEIDELRYEAACTSTDYDTCECGHVHEEHDDDGCACCACEGFEEL